MERLTQTKPGKPKPSAVNFLSEDTPIADAFEPVGSAVIVPPKWIIKNVIPVGLTIYIAPPKSYKSTTMLHWILRCIGKKTSTLLPEHLSQAERVGPVVMIATETTPGTVKFDALFGLRVHVLDSDPLYCQSNPFAFRLDDPDNMKELVYWLGRINPSMLVIDPLRNSHGVDENDAGEMVKMVQPLQQYAIRNNMACVIVHHTKKPSDKAKPDDILRPDMARGTSALFGLADGLLSQVILNNELEQPELRIAGVYKRGVALTEDVNLNVEWAAMKLDTAIAATVYNLIHAEPQTTSGLMVKTGLKENEVLKYLNYMYKSKIINRVLTTWEVEH